MNKFHHHFEHPWTDTNYGNIFSFWDRIFGPMVYDNPKKVTYHEGSFRGLRIKQMSRTTVLRRRKPSFLLKGAVKAYLAPKPHIGGDRRDFVIAVSLSL